VAEEYPEMNTEGETLFFSLSSPTDEQEARLEMAKEFASPELVNLVPQEFSCLLFTQSSTRVRKGRTETDEATN